MADVEARVNDVVLDDLAVHAEVMSQREAVASGAMALFGEKYGDRVRVVSVGDWAREAVRRHHAGSSGKLGVIKLLGSRRSARACAGSRPSSAATPTASWRASTCWSTSSPTPSRCVPSSCPERVNDIVEKLRAAEKEIEKVRVQQLLCGRRGAGCRGGEGRAGQPRRAPRRRGGRRRRAHPRARRPRSAAAGRAGGRRGRRVPDGKVSVVAAVNDEGRARGLSANELVRTVGPLVGGKGGGKDDVAQGGGTDSSRIDEALAAVATAVGRLAGA